MSHPLAPLSLYVHIPWCVKKCPYCDFNSHSLGSNVIDEPGYLNALLADLSQDLDLVLGRTIDTVFVGGGTPSLMSGRFYGELFSQVDRLIGFSNQVEITLEANPGTVERTDFGELKAAGVNRLSLGVQSFSKQQLQRLGRIHQPEDVHLAFSLARKAGIERINLDLMFALENQTHQQALDDLSQAMDLGPEHLSWYQLTIEPNTEFYARPPQQPDDERIWEMQLAGQALLANRGYQQYEISAYAQKGEASRHNLNYWQFGDYIGIGAGAHGKATLAEGKILRTQKTRMPTNYLNQERIQFGQRNWVDTKELPFEFMMNALRLKDGVPGSLYSQRTTLDLDDLRPVLNKLVLQGLIEVTPRLKTTNLGAQYLNEVLERFL